MVFLIACMTLFAQLAPAAAAAQLPTALDEEFLTLLNDERGARGLGPLAVMDELVEGAVDQAERMADAGYLFHNPNLGSVVADGWAKLGENVGFGYSASTLHDAFMNSAAHRDNVLDTGYDHIGIGTVVETDGTIWVAFVFVDMLGVEPPPSGADLQPSKYVGRFFDDDGSVFEPAIEALAAAGVTSGCADARFCPDDAVTRGQMAAFLARAMDLTETSGNTFSDDDGSVFEDAIEALVGAGVTSGCAEASFCPDDPVSRGQMAAFLVRALDLPRAGGDRFSDDDNSEFEATIESLAAAGITSGCAEGLFCPDDPVTRGQMAAFLTAAFDL